jgi:hypothetical protein
MLHPQRQNRHRDRDGARESRWRPELERFYLEQKRSSPYFTSNFISLRSLRDLVGLISL